MTALSRRNFLFAGAAGLAFSPLARSGAAAAERGACAIGTPQVALAADHAWFDPLGDAIPCRFAVLPAAPALPEVDLAWLGV